MSNYITYPHGFRSLSSRDKDDKTNFVYDRDIEAIYRSYINREVDFNDWNFRLNMFEECFRLFGANFEEWVLYQINKNTLIYDHSLDFLLDTLNFIIGQPRKVSIFVWRELMLTDPENKSNIEISNRKINRLKDLYPKIPTQTSDIIQLWCSQEDGFEDMLTTMFLLFGPAPKLNNKAIQGSKL
jgi:hypothetical protein